MEMPMVSGSSRTEVTSVLIAAPRSDLCLDYANTLFWRGSTPEETLHAFPDLLEWCVKAGELPKAEASGYRALAKNDPVLAAKIFGDSIAIREAIYRVVLAAATRRISSDADLRLLNDSLKSAPTRTRIEKTREHFAWRVEQPKPDAATMLAPILWSAADLLVGPGLLRVRHCANDRCLWIFLDESKNRSRRWCSMQSCGNRAKAHRHYLREMQS